MRLADTAHWGQPWRIHELAADFRLEDVWAIRTPGAGAEDFPEMLEAMEAAFEPARQPWPLRFLFAVRFKLGALLGWDKAESAPAARGGSLRERLPDDLRATLTADDVVATGANDFTTLYALDRECAREMANHTAHAIMHLGWVPAAGGDHELRMAVLVRPNGRLGRLYMAAIGPLRHLVVLPAMTRVWERAWRERASRERGGAQDGSGARDGSGAKGGSGAPDGSGTPGGPRKVRSAVGRRAVPAEAQALSSLPDADYVDWFALATDTAGDVTAEQWARAMFGDVPSRSERFIWRGLLGLRLAEGRSPRTVAGWRLAARGDDWVRLETESGFLTGNLVVRAADGQLSLTTLLRYDRPLGRRIWPPLSAVHRGLCPGLLRETVAKVEAGRRV